MEFGSDILSLFTGTMPSIDNGAGSADFSGDSLDMIPLDIQPDAKIDLPTSDMEAPPKFDVHLDSYLSYSPAPSAPDSPPDAIEPDLFVPSDMDMLVNAGPVPMTENTVGASNTASRAPKTAKALKATQSAAVLPKATTQKKRGSKKKKGLPSTQGDAIVPVSQTTPETKKKRTHSAATESAASAMKQETSENGMANEQMSKKARRMQKNRESAMLSRQRKKEQFSTLEASHQQLVEANAILMADKENLQRRVSQLEVENQSLRKELNHIKFTTPAPSSVLSNFNKTTLMACLICVGLYVSPMASQQSLSISVSRGDAPSLTPIHHVGRTLQSVDAIPAETAVVTSLRSASRKNPRSQEVDHPRITDITSRFNLSSFDAIPSNHSKNKPVTGTDLVATGSDMDNVQQDWPVPPVFRLNNGLSSSQMKSIRKREDTSYFFCSEVQILSADKLNEDGVARMSMLIPAPDASTAGPKAGLNRTEPTLVQIDSNIVNYKAIQLSNNSSV